MRQPPIPDGLFIGAFVELEIGRRYDGLANADKSGAMWEDQPYVVLRVATVEEFIAEDPARRAASPHLSQCVAFYQVSTD